VVAAMSVFYGSMKVMGVADDGGLVLPRSFLPGAAAPRTILLTREQCSRKRSPISRIAYAPLA
jgi:hypothetical protein